MILTGTNGGTYTLGPISYDSATNIATIPVVDGISTDSLVLSIFSGNVTDADGNALDGEFTSRQTDPSGDGTAGGQFNFFFNVLPGDADSSGQVNTIDAISVFASNTQAVSATNFRRDINGSGQVNTIDAISLFANNTAGLPAAPTAPAAPTPPASLTAPANFSVAASSFAIVDELFSQSVIEETPVAGLANNADRPKLSGSLDDRQDTLTPLADRIEDTEDRSDDEARDDLFSKFDDDDLNEDGVFDQRESHLV